MTKKRIKKFVEDGSLIGGFQMNNKVQKMVSIAMLAAIGTVLQFVAFPIMPAFSFLKIDFSDIPILLGMFLYGPLAGVITAFVRSLLHLFLTGLAPQNMVGDFASFLASSIFTLPIFYFFGKKKNIRTNRIMGLVSGILALTIFMSIANYFVITPIYLQLYGVTTQQFLGTSLASYVAIGIVPFNLIKGLLVSGVFLVLHAKLLPWLSKKQHTIQKKTPLTK
ncbi:MULTISPECIES: ECF transporter S component [Enterococcus]|uniref:ECF transporter S component n=1 Tax=Enterococcus TaxID=1350 RepID=UPI000354392B|nr:MULTISPECIES: ECF transporter S component [Enterococcus]EGO2630190.1 ECF transporter S component [Enterococcus faecalis]EGO6568742.1 ECF transporter S component [Enterococcus faecalis]EGO6570753.1 ECF transporter S component [Enterococcus faecalis]EGO6633954.1 ECF transporter S component [Enterococcus faecalis]EGO6689894.1 ECF transporter S component [Enterococcus faecalis]